MQPQFEEHMPLLAPGEQWSVALAGEVVVSPLYLCWRNTLDVVFGLLGLAVLIALGPFIALAIRWDSPGPILYSQLRTGRAGKPFRLYKFRSMYRDAEPDGQALWAQRYDRRVTRVGRLLRMTHLDELPQIWNILRGEMSLIGPRPERIEFVAELERSIPYFRDRLLVKPGLTGLAQVKLRYTSSQEETLEKVLYDLYYIKHQTIVLDASILVSTVSEILFCRGT